MKFVACNPYLSLHEYVPDDEPRVSDGCSYIYGSHDTSSGDWLCLEDYVVWFAPIDDLNQWYCGGTSYQREQDPHNADGRWELFVLDAVKGSDGRYHLFYRLRMQQEFGVVISGNPAGPFASYGHIHYPDGSIFRENMSCNPAVLVDDGGRIYLYYGYTSEVIATRPGATVSPGCMVVELKPDMVMVVGASNICLSRDTHMKGTGSENYGYYGGLSVRRMNEHYYPVFSSKVYHELYHAVNDRPRDGFMCGGVIVPNEDIGMYGWQYPVCPSGNNHGRLTCIKGQYYVFYQRHTQHTQFSGQGCVELVSILPDGSIPQMEMTSSGLNGGLLPTKGVRSAACAYHLTHVDEEKMLRCRETDSAVLPFIREEAATAGKEAGNSYIHNITDGTTIGFKYFQADSVNKAVLVLWGTCSEHPVLYSGEMAEERVLTAASVEAESVEQQEVSVPVTWDGVYVLYLRYQGESSTDLKELEPGEQGK